MNEWTRATYLLPSFWFGYSVSESEKANASEKHNNYFSFGYIHKILKEFAINIT